MKNTITAAEKSTTLCDICIKECKMADGVLNCSDFNLSNQLKSCSDCSCKK